MDNLAEPLTELALQGLPELKPLPAQWSLFSIPKLHDKPQNPIISTVERLRDLTPLPGTPPYNPATILPPIYTTGKEDSEGSEDVWLEAKDNVSEYKNHIVSWDTLRSTYRHPQNPSPFISEQAPKTIAAAINRAQMHPSFPVKKSMSISAAGLHDALGSTLVGCSSVLHDWNADEERFIPVGANEEKKQVLLDGMDEIVSNSYASQFIKFGTLLRRLESLVTHLRSSARDNNSTVFAFAHSLSSVLTWVRNEISDVLFTMRNAVCDIWVSFQETQSVLLTLASLCSRDYDLDPKLYVPLPRTPQKLLSHIYDFLDLLVEQQAPRTVRAVLSYILTITSRPYLTSIARSIGLEGLDDTLADARRIATKSLDDSLVGDQEVNGLDEESDSDLENDNGEDFPSFMSEETRNAIVRARRSIRILSSPEFEGSEAVELPVTRKLEWVWTDIEVSSLALGHERGILDANPDGMAHISQEDVPEATSQKYKPELSRFAVFDLVPDRPSNKDIILFINSYTDYLPSLTPTLPLLAEHILAPASTQAATLGRAALRRFLTPGTLLHLRAHLVLLRAYLLLAAPAFKARLAAALFSDADADNDADETAEENPMGVTIRSRARNANWRAVQHKTVGTRDSETGEQPWAVGLAFGLTERAQWPPGGSDLSFYLRRVIMDSLEHVRDSEDNYFGLGHKSELGDDAFWDEAESRLGFAIRDLPVGMGREKWLDPTLIEALDFLYMEYRPPPPLRPLITPDILSKYQRVFAFLLRLLRVETAMRLVFRLTRPYSADRVFTDYPETQNLILHFRFSAQAFVSALSAYVADTAIRGNIDAFIARVQSAEKSATSDMVSDSTSFADVFALMQRHSRVLDAVLAACLLRGAQRAIGDILRALLEVILEFAVLVGNSYRSASERRQSRNFDEDQAANRVEALYAKFCKTRDALIKALRKVTERGSKAFAMEKSGRSSEGLPSAPGGMEALSNLLLRLGAADNGKQ